MSIRSTRIGSASWPKLRRGRRLRPKQQFTTVKVSKRGDEPERQVFIVGRTGDGRLAGLQTPLVETEIAPSRVRAKDNTTLTVTEGKAPLIPRPGKGLSL
jgi:hypothetical protein